MIGDDEPEHDELDDDDPVDEQLAEDNRKLTEIEIRRAEAEQFWKQIFAHPVGRREMWGILDNGSAFEDRFGASPTGFPDPLASYGYAGEQRLALRLYHSWQILSPEGTLLMMQEHHPAFKKPERPKRKRGRK